MIVALHIAHIASGTLFVGAHIATALVLLPALDVMSRETFRASVKAVGLVAATSGGLTLVLGLIRAIMGGLGGPGDWVATSYGITASLALAIMLGLSIHGAWLGRQIESRVWSGTGLRAGGRGFLIRAIFVDLLGCGTILVCMGLMHFGL